MLNTHGWFFYNKWFERYFSKKLWYFSSMYFFWSATQFKYQNHALHWRHNEHDGVSNHRRLHCFCLLVQAQVKGNIIAPRDWPLWGEFPGDRWIHRTKGQSRGKCFHLMTSSWTTSSPVILICMHGVTQTATTLYEFPRHFDVESRQQLFICSCMLQFACDVQTTLL